MTIDELTVELRLDDRNFTKGQRDALDAFKKTDEEFRKRQQGMEAANEKVALSFEGITAGAVGLLSVLAGAGIASFVKGTMDSVAATGRMATNVGVATQELSAFGRMIERNGGSADTAMGSMKGFTDQITRLKTLGQGSDDLFRFLGTIGFKDGDSSLDAFMKFADYAEKHKDNAQIVNQVGQWGGYDQGTINTALKGRTELLKEYAAAMKGAVSPEQAAAMVRLQSAWVGLDQAVENTGRDVATNAEPAITSVAGAITRWIEGNQKLADSLGTVLALVTAIGSASGLGKLLALIGAKTGLSGLSKAGARITGVAALPGRAIKGGGVGGMALGVAETMKYDSQHGNELRTWLRAQLGIEDPGEAAPWAGARSNGTAASPAAGGRDSAEVREARIRSNAKMLGINPDVAMAVARSEGFNNFKNSIPGEQSFGDFQLHVTPGGRGHAVGDEFQRLKGLDPSDPANEAASDLFALQHAARFSWHDFHGAANTGIGDRQGIGDVHIDTITINTDSKDPRQHGRLVADAVRNNLGSSKANQGLTQ